MSKKFIEINKKIKKFQNKIRVGGDKSISIRWALLASQAFGMSKAKNLLKSEDVVSAMAEAYRETGEGDLAERLLITLEAGKRAGGQANSEGLPLPEKSAALIVKGNDIIQNVDLRIDLHDDAVTELRKVYKTYLSYREYYELRARRPEKTPAQDVWVKQSLIEK